MVYRREISIDQTIDNGVDEQENHILDKGAVTQHTGERYIMRKECRELIDAAYVVLDWRERIIMDQRFGVHGEEERTLEAIGKKLNLSRERVRQLERDAKNKLRTFYKETKGMKNGTALYAPEGEIDKTIYL